MRVWPLFLTLPFIVSAAVTSAPVDRSAMVEHEIKALEFDGGGLALTPQER